MNRTEVLELIAEVLECERDTLQGPEVLADTGWDSLSVLSFIALVQERCDLLISPVGLAECRTVEDLLGLVQRHLAARV